MARRRITTIAGIALACVGTQSLRAQADTTCDPDGYATRPKAEQHAIDSAYKAEPRLEEIRVVLHAPQKVVREKVKLAMLACNIPLVQASEGIYEAHYAAETTAYGQYTLATRAYVVPMDDSTTMVRLSGVETTKTGNNGSSLTTNPISNKNSGRSGKAWLALRNVAKQLRANTALESDVAASTRLGVLFTP